MKMNQLLMGATALISATTLIAGSASAAVSGTVTGGGSTLIGPYLRVVANCFGATVPLQVQGSYPYSGAGETFVTLGKYAGCTTANPAAQINYVNSGSGNGQLGVFTHDVAIDVGTSMLDAASGNTISSIQFGAGDYGIGAADVAAYNNGGTLSQKTGASSSNVVTLLSPTDATTPSGLTYANPKNLYGAFIEFPISIDAVAVTYASTYKVVNNAVTGTVTSYHFNVKKPNKDGSGGLVLDMPTVCAIFNGAITNWNDPVLRTLNGGVSLADKTDPAFASFSVPIQLVGRSDGSGTTSIFYRALAAQCTGTYSGGTYTNNYVAAGGKTLPSALLNASNVAEGTVAGKFNTYKGTTAVATAVGTIPTPASGGTVLHGTISYIGTDYVVPEATTTVAGINNYNLQVANLTYAGKTVEPTAAAVLKSFGAILPPQSDKSGKYVAATTTVGVRSAPQDWVQPISTTLTYSNGASAVPTPLANPGVAGGYPIIGTTNIFLNTCYTASNYDVMKAFLTYYNSADLVNNAKTGLLQAAGFGVLPKAWLTAINQTFINPTTVTKTVKVPKSGTTPASSYVTDTGTDTLNLAISKPGVTPVTYGAPGATYVVGNQCAASTITGA